jgi:hypothetical protein
MGCSVRLVLRGFLFLTWSSLYAVAGQPFPCPKAVSSSNGNFLVLSDVQFKPGPENTMRVQGVSLQVFPKEEFLNPKDKLTTTATYWTDWLRWSVVLDSMSMLNEPECPMPLITDDGEFLILLRLGAVFSGEDAVLQIYRRRDHQGGPMREGPDHGVFIKAIALKEIWSPDKVAANTEVWTDSTPEWFGGGTFEFSPDCRELTHQTRWGNTVRIKLDDGSTLWK